MKNLRTFLVLNEQTIIAKKHLVIGAGGENDPPTGGTDPTQQGKGNVPPPMN